MDKFDYITLKEAYLDDKSKFYYQEGQISGHKILFSTNQVKFKVYQEVYQVEEFVSNLPISSGITDYFLPVKKIKSYNKF